MELYTRRQLVLLLGLLGAALAGLGVAHWRARHPELVHRLEQWDRAPARANRSTTGQPPAGGDDETGGARDLADPGPRATEPDPRSRAGRAAGAGARASVPTAGARLEPASPGSGDASHATRRELGPPTREGPRQRPVKLPSAPTGEPPPGPLDLNRAGPEELVRLPGVGPALAARIVAAREAVGRFASVDDLERVRGLGRAKIERLRPLVVAGE